MVWRNNQQGFTLIELVAVIVILGILATAVSKYIVFGTQIYVEGTARQETLSKSRFVIDRLSRELRTALPYSVRISASQACLQFVPIVSSGTYRTDSGATAPPISPITGNAIDVISWSGSLSVGDRFYIYATEEDHIYLNTDRFKIIDSVSAGSGPDYSVTFDNTQNATAFDQASPRERYFTADSMVFYCVVNGNMYRWETPEINNLAFSEDGIAYLGVLMAEGITNTVLSEPPFSYNAGALFRNSVITLYLEFNANDNEDMFFNHEVHIPNVP